LSVAVGKLPAWFTRGKMSDFDYIKLGSQVLSLGNKITITVVKAII